MDLVSRTLSPRGLKIFYGVAAPLLGAATYDLFTGSGLVGWLTAWLTEHTGPSRKNTKLAFALTLVPILAIAAVPAYLHDYVLKLGMFGPKPAKPPGEPDRPPDRPFDRLRDW